MKKIYKYIVSSTILAFCGAGIIHGQTVTPDVLQIDKADRYQSQPNEYIIKVKSQSEIQLSSYAKGITPQQSSLLNQTLSEIGTVVVEQLQNEQATSNTSQAKSGSSVANSSALYLIKTDNTRLSSSQVIEKLSSLDDLEYAEPNYLVYAMASSEGETLEDPYYIDQWGLDAIHMPALWNKTPITSKRPVIAILDTGVDITHPDLAANIWTNTSEETGTSSRDDDSNGYKDDIHGWDFISNSPDISDENGHGTHCAGIAGAVSYNGIGIMGANPDAYIMPVTIMNREGKGSISTIIKGLNYAVANGADVISMSFGSYSQSQAFEEALLWAKEKAILVAAAGNDNICLYDTHKKKHGDRTTDHIPCYPGAYSFVIGVQATDKSGEYASFSNFDCDGPTSSSFTETEQYNYELSAPGQDIISTYPGGKYKKLSGTSMACPLVAGAISRLIQLKEYTNNEELLSDLIHVTTTKNIDAEAVFNNDNSKRTPTLEIIATSADDSLLGDGDGNFDAGETIDVYPTVRNVWGYAKNITLSLTVAENEDPDIIQIIDNDVVDGITLSPYASVKSVKPLRFKIADNCADNRIINLVLKATAENASNIAQLNFSISVDNGKDLYGYFDKDTTLEKNTTYNVTSNIAIPEGVTFTIPEGCKLKIKKGVLNSSGTLNITGTPDNPVVITGTPDNPVVITGNAEIITEHGTAKYMKTYIPVDIKNGVLEDCIYFGCGSTHGGECIRCCFYNGSVGASGNYCNIVNNKGASSTCGNQNILNNEVGPDYKYRISIATKDLQFITLAHSYFGTANKNILDAQIYHSVLSEVYLTDIADRPYSEAHGLVWKVLVDGKDAQDEYDLMPPMGIGKHKFDVYFNRQMDKNYTPEVSMGVKIPYTQVAITEDGAWNEDTTVYTVYLTLTGKEKIDGINRIYVAGAEDLEHFPIPDEKMRFNVNVNIAGTLETGLVATAGLGKVNLEWQTSQSDFPDMQGYNIYRYTQREEKYKVVEYDYNLGKYVAVEKTRIINDTTLVNNSLLDVGESTYVDYDVVPGTTYFYFVREMYTDMKQISISNTVAVAPQTATIGDSNGSGSVDVADIVTDVAYLSNEDPKPFIFEAADVNKDNELDIIDIVKTVNIIYNNSSVKSKSNTYSIPEAVFGIANNQLYVKCPVAIAGAEVLVETSSPVLSAQNVVCMEQVISKTADNEKLYLSYSLNGSTFPAGKNILLQLADDAIIKDIILSDAVGGRIIVTSDGTTSIKRTEIAPAAIVNVVVTDIMGRRIRNFNSVAKSIENNEVLKSLNQGVYILNCYKDGMPIMTKKVVIAH